MKSSPDAVAAALAAGLGAIRSHVAKLLLSLQDFTITSACPFRGETMKYLPLVISATLLALPQPAAAIPRTEKAILAQIEICRTSLEMVRDGASDDEETDYLVAQLERNGWDEETDLDDLMLVCIFFKQGWLHSQSE
ncbi:hypothetical protein GRI89_02060 [Altererythrobacter salegens]|uniref:Uncharacterized protein n=1 Tax=Croceibacterium salegens TaxID=1737568 RepID=A0A6I4SRZ4_9SPHN|nr:hypothetical protein [Croceibacterium salegens]MXO58329.1 hypothetical protein [Croceibacterium salegens]